MTHSTALVTRSIVLGIRCEHVVGPPWAAGVTHEVVDVLLQVVDAVAHVVYPGDDLVGHGLEAVLHLLQHVLDVARQLVDVLGLLGLGGRSAAFGGRPGDRGRGGGVVAPLGGGGEVV